MIESLLTLILIGISAGFIFAMPIAGPISIIITSNALKGNLKFCIRTALGASIIESIYVLVAVLGLSALVSAYSPLIPYLILVGSFFIFVVGIKIFKSKLSLEDIDKSKTKAEIKDKGGLRTGIFLNITNPSFFFGILASSFLVLTFASSIGLNTGGLDLLIQENVTSFQEITNEELPKLDSTYVLPKNSNEKPEHSSYTFLLSLAYAISLGAGGFIWLVILARLLVKYRLKIKIEILTWIIRSMGIALCGIGVYLFWKSINIFLS